MNNEPKFTKGNWKIKFIRNPNDGLAYGFKITPPGKIMPLANPGCWSDSKVHVLAPEYQHADFAKGHYTGEELEACGNLMCASPSLYAALELALKREKENLADYGDPQVRRGLYPDLDATRDAIEIYESALAKAVGKEDGK